MRRVRTVRLILVVAQGDTRSMHQKPVELAQRFAATAWALALVAVAFHPADAQSQMGPTLISHDFTESAQGWHISGDSERIDPIFSVSGGHPGGCITGVDEALGETWYFQAPFTVLQQLPHAINGT